MFAVLKRTILFVPWSPIQKLAPSLQAPNGIDLGPVEKNPIALKSLLQNRPNPPSPASSFNASQKLSPSLQAQTVGNPVAKKPIGVRSAAFQSVTFGRKLSVISTR